MKSPPFAVAQAKSEIFRSCARIWVIDMFLFFTRGALIRFTSNASSSRRRRPVAVRAHGELEEKSIMALSWIITPFLMMASLTRAYVIHWPLEINNTSPSIPLQHDQRAGPDPANLSGIKRWAAIGDSFTAGIGSENLYSQVSDDFKCCRYDHAYPAIISNALGPIVQDFQYVTCSGDRFVQFYEQVSNMKGNLDFVIMTVGGNDLCLVRPDHLHITERLSLTAHHLHRLVLTRPVSSYRSRASRVSGNRRQSTGKCWHYFGAEPERNPPGPERQSEHGQCRAIQ